jgi:hypothetical protein
MHGVAPQQQPLFLRDVNEASAQAIARAIVYRDYEEDQVVFYQVNPTLLYDY